MGMSKTAYVVTSGMYSDYHIVAVKSTEEAALVILKENSCKCGTCRGTGRFTPKRSPERDCKPCEGRGWRTGHYIEEFDFA